MRYYVSIGITVWAIILAVSFGPIACGEAKTRSYDGVWKSDGDFIFVAKISDGHIRVVWEVDDSTSGIYWDGTFPSKGTKIVSKGVRDTLDASLVGSSDNTKKFTYKNGKLSFDFHAMGMKRRINLER